ncbi:TIGR02680 family protein [Streptomyces boncukensis]|uniref:TIGR02680 family protein n=1 Tax=Streptomyces boncukensis TaxID=2711219 RepID=A0A6G4WQC5_9ACTN|nr:TIGR02680 family protein [Streptomyces boncukensis]NGO67298.1 TIGR02680 family protein [Streptomyces boncukensis]
MTSRSTAPIPLQRSSASLSPRYRLHRAGIVNVWQYDQQEFLFGDGRLLLRGKNGAGKSKALEMLLPYLLDGDARALDATGTGRTTLAWLMLDGFEGTNRLGYLWVEFRMATEDGGEEYLTLGAALRASKSTKKATPSFFLTPLRVGEDLVLVDSGKPLPVEGLKAAVGSANVTERAVEHRGTVARRLFGITEPRRYRNLTQQLHRLRRPTVGDRIESGGLTTLLSETLPGLDEEVVDKVARNLHDLDSVRDKLGRLELTDGALRAFLTKYSAYLRGVLHRSADGVHRELELLAKRRKDAGDAGKTTATLKQQESETGARLASLEKELDDARAELDALHASDGYRSLQDLAERRNTVTALHSAAESAHTALLSSHSAERAATKQLAQGRDRFGSRFRTLSDDHRDALSEAERAGMALSHFGEAPSVPVTVLAPPTESELVGPDEEVQRLERGNVTAVDIDAADTALRAWEQQLAHAASVAQYRSRMVSGVQRLIDLFQKAQSAADHADAERERLDEATEDAEGRRDTAQQAVAAESTVYAGQVETWLARRGPGSGDPDAPSLDTVRPLIGLAASSNAPFEERVLAADVDARVEERARALLAPHAEELAARRDHLVLAIGRTADERDLLVRTRQEWEQRTDPQPPVPHHRAAARAPGTGAPFYQLVDFAESVSDAERAGLEAALEASGLLDAWVTAEGTLLGPGTRDTLLDPMTTVASGPTLAAALRPVVPQDSGLTVAQVELVLSAIALAPAEDASSVSAVSYEGRWRLGAARGRHAKEHAEYVGAAVRAETRRRKLADLAEQIATVEQRLSSEQAVLAEVDGRRQALDTALRELPRARLLATAWARLEDAEKSCAELSGKAKKAAHDAETARAHAVAARTEAESTASAHDLPARAEALSDVRSSLTALSSATRRLRKAVLSTAEELISSRVEIHAYQRAYEERTEAERQYRLRMDELTPARAALRTLDETVGADEGDILAREEATKQRITTAKKQLGTTRGHLTDLHDRAVRAEEDEKQHRQALASQADSVISVGRSLRRLVARPEVLRGAELATTASALGSTEAPGTDVRTRIRHLQEFTDRVRDALGPAASEVSDTTLVNRYTELRDQLAGGYDAQLEESDGVKVCRLLDDHGPHDVVAVGERIAAQAAEARGRLTEREREVFQRFLTGELGDHLSAQVLAAAGLVAALNDTLKTVRTSHGLGIELQWGLHEDVGADVRAAVELLRSPSGLRTREQGEQLREVLQRRIEDARKADPSAGYAEHLRTALDYRDWFRFHTYVVDDASPGHKRRLTGRTGLSQGEQRVLSYLVLFAAAAAHFSTVGETTPHAPRLILLDDAFAKVDEPTHGRLGRILVDLDLDFVLTSERLMGNWPEVPSLHIYECLRDPSARGVASLHYTWNGRQRRLMPV